MRAGSFVSTADLNREGNGWLRIVRFVPDQNKIEVRAYAPLLDTTMDNSGHTFTLDYDMTSQAALKKAGG